MASSRNLDMSSIQDDFLQKLKENKVRSNDADYWAADEEESLIEDFESDMKQALQWAVDEYQEWLEEECDDCEGTGECPFCNGEGTCSTYQGPEDDHSECRECEGTNECGECDGSKECQECWGTGKENDREGLTN